MSLKIKNKLFNIEQFRKRFVDLRPETPPAKDKSKSVPPLDQYSLTSCLLF